MYTHIWYAVSHWLIERVLRACFCLEKDTRQWNWFLSWISFVCKVSWRESLGGGGTFSINEYRVRLYNFRQWKSLHTLSFWYSVKWACCCYLIYKWLKKEQKKKKKYKRVRQAEKETINSTNHLFSSTQGTLSATFYRLECNRWRASNPDILHRPGETIQLDYSKLFTAAKLRFGCVKKESLRKSTFKKEKKKERKKEKNRMSMKNFLVETNFLLFFFFLDSSQNQTDWNKKKDRKEKKKKGKKSRRNNVSV